ncbi:hypothetical protein LJR219_004814 [Phenylobacterium sp. LjRoot219]
MALELRAEVRRMIGGGLVEGQNLQPRGEPLHLSAVVRWPR